MQERRKRMEYYIAYSVIFLLFSALIIYIFYHQGYCFVWGKDGAAQHYPTLVYIHRYIREFFGNLLHGRWRLPMVDYTIGEGMDVITTLNYYGFGDPLLLLAGICPESGLEILYGLLIFVRMYLSGIFFSWFCFEKKHTQRTAVLLGAVSYVFCEYALFGGIRHPFFLNGMMYLPLYLLGVERILQKKRYGIFSVAVCLSLISNFYFGYMNTIMMALYVVFVLFPQPQKRIREKAAILIRMIGAYLAGVMASGAIMFPVVSAYLSCSRSGEGGYTESLLQYPEWFYDNLKEGYFHTNLYVGQWTTLGFTYLAGVGVLILFLRWSRSRRERLRNWALRIGFVLLTVMLCVPLAGRVMNGFGYASNRWDYAYAMLISYIMVVTLPMLLHLLSRRLPVWIEKTNRHLAVVAGVFASQRFWCALLSVVLLVNLEANIVDAFGRDGCTKLSEYSQIGTSAGDDQGMTQMQADSDGFCRIETPWHIGNQSLEEQYQGHNWYFSIAPGWYFDYYHQFLLNSMERKYSLRGLDSRTALNEVAATKYYVAGQEENPMVPYGYKYIGTNEAGRYVYENQNFLPLGYTVSGWMKKSDFELLSPIDRQEVLLQAAVLEDDDADRVSLMPSAASNLKIDTAQEACTVVSCSGITWDKNMLHVTQDGGSIELRFRGRANCETYLWFNEFQVKWASAQYQVGSVTAAGRTNQFVLMDPRKSAWYDEPSQTVNLGYSKEPVTSCVITFPKRGLYSLDEFLVVYESMDNYQTKTDVLRQDTLQNCKVETNRISGDMNLSKTKLLQLSIPYSSGWSATVNGKKAKILCSQDMYMAIELGSGRSHVELRYTTPWLKAGVGSSAAGVVIIWMMFFGVPHVRRSRKKKG